MQERKKAGKKTHKQNPALNKNPVVYLHTTEKIKESHCFLNRYDIIMFICK